MTEKIHIAGLSRTELEELAAGFGEPKYRATQVFKAVHERRLRSFDEITDLPKKFRARLVESAEISRLSVESKYVSTDGTRRYLMKTTDGNPVETVFIPSEGRDTICFSSQSGCPLKCDFCLTAKLGLLRNLTVGEIVEQIIIVLNDVYGVGGETPHGTNLVGMGAGEPFLNFENLISALRIMADEDGLFIVPNRVTVSTAGIVPRIYDLANIEDRPHLAISLSSASDELRDRLMPINKRWDLAELMSAAKEFEASLRRGERFTFEYVMLGGVNDSDRDASDLADLLERFQLRRVKVNLIPHNGAEQLDYSTSSEDRVTRFKAVLESRGVSAYVRSPRGRDIYAACGQLAAKDSPSLVQIAA
ncbi:MAG TPA: 23S rRNA (adenine(2503)-C(2))-methyltransferase RlmN [Pyrinomonadaceae bacterium]|nr:23S rRNA (adenine(2503)-C(2))-methyltransferase RlmN [Pyrinomonadaceae bacterium]